MKIQENLGRPTWAEVDLDRLASNVKEFLRVIPGSSQLMAVVKANAYGHGAVEVSRKALEAGAAMLGVASLEEGAELRRNGIHAPILILGHTDPHLCAELCRLDLTPTVFSWDEAVLLSRRARELGRSLNVHAKLDTGMGRLGIGDRREAVRFLEELHKLPDLSLEGIYTHFACADEAEKNYTEYQLQRYREILRELESRGVTVPLTHAANSAATLEHPASVLDMVRVGISLYGYYPSPEVGREQIRLLPVLSLKTRIIFLKKVARGTPISYGRTYYTPRETVIATVPLGYADGFSRSLSNSGFMLVKGQRAPVVGRVCMDLTMLDVGHISGVREGDEVVAYGCQGSESIDADEIASQLGTISYEVLCRISPRVPRFYLSAAKTE